MTSVRTRLRGEMISGAEDCSLQRMAQRSADVDIIFHNLDTADCGRQEADDEDNDSNG